MIVHIAAILLLIYTFYFNFSNYNSIIFFVIISFIQPNLRKMQC